MNNKPRSITSKSHNTIIGTNTINETSPIFGIANNTSADLVIEFNGGGGTFKIAAGTIWIFEPTISAIVGTIEVTSTVAETIGYLI